MFFRNRDEVEQKRNEFNIKHYHTGNDIWAQRQDELNALLARIDNGKLSKGSDYKV